MKNESSLKIYLKKLPLLKLLNGTKQDYKVSKLIIHQMKGLEGLIKKVNFGFELLINIVLKGAL